MKCKMNTTKALLASIKVEKNEDGFLAKIKALANNPHPRGSRKIMDSDNFWRIRIGSYRVLYETSPDESGRVPSDVNLKL